MTLLTPDVRISFLKEKNRLNLHLVSFIKYISILFFLYGQYYYTHIEIQLIVRRKKMTITLKKNSVDVRVELRRNDSDFIGDDRAYYA